MAPLRALTSLAALRLRGTPRLSLCLAAMTCLQALRPLDVGELQDSLYSKRPSHARCGAGRWWGARATCMHGRACAAAAACDPGLHCWLRAAHLLFYCNRPQALCADNVDGFPPALAGLPALRCQCLQNFAGWMADCALPRRPWLRSICWLGLPWELAAGPGAAETPSLAPHPECLASLGAAPGIDAPQQGQGGDGLAERWGLGRDLGLGCPVAPAATPPG